MNWCIGRFLWNSLHALWIWKSAYHYTCNYTENYEEDSFKTLGDVNILRTILLFLSQILGSRRSEKVRQIHYMLSFSIKLFNFINGTSTKLSKMLLNDSLCHFPYFFEARSKLQDAFLMYIILIARCHIFLIHLFNCSMLV